MPALKVYRTPIGFHDAYVAATSQKAALKAWGSDADLFACGVAELVDDPELTAEPLAHPGQVIRKSRGSAAEQLAALPPDPPKRERKAEPQPASKATPGTKAKPTPRPDRGPVEAAEQALSRAQERQRREERALAAEEAALAERRRTMRVTHEDETAKLEAARDTAELAYADALRAWRDAASASGG